MKEKQIDEGSNRDFTKLIELIRSFREGQSIDLHLTLNLINVSKRSEYLSSELLSLKNELAKCDYNYRSDVHNEINRFISIYNESLVLQKANNEYLSKYYDTWEHKFLNINIDKIFEIHSENNPPPDNYNPDEGQCYNPDADWENIIWQIEKYEPKILFEYPEFIAFYECIRGITKFQILYTEYQVITNGILNDGHSNNKVGIESSLTPKLVCEIFDLLIDSNFIYNEVEVEHFKSIFNGSQIPEMYQNEKIEWRGSIPLFCCLFFGYSELTYKGDQISFDGIIDTNAYHVLKKMVALFSFGPRKMTNKILSIAISKISGSNAPRSFMKIYNIIKLVSSSTS